MLIVPSASASIHLIVVQATLVVGKYTIFRFGATSADRAITLSDGIALSGVLADIVSYLSRIR